MKENCCFRPLKSLYRIVFVLGLAMAFLINAPVAEAEENNISIYLKFLEATDAVPRKDLRFWELTEGEYSSLRKMAQNLVKGMNSDYDKAVTLNNWITDNIYYDFDSYNGRSARVSAKPDDVVKTKRAVCEGYAKLTEVFYNAVGIPCYYVSGIGSGGDHAWNVAYVENQWILLDNTWDCGNKYENGTFHKGSSRNKYFNMNLDEFSSDHIQRGDFNGAYHNVVYELNVDTKELSVSGAIENRAHVEIAESVGGYPVTAVGDGALSGHAYGDSIKKPGAYDWVKSVTLPKTIKKIGASAFAYCTSLESIEIPDSVMEIKHNAFTSCSSLKEIRIPEGVERIGYETFMNCQTLAKVDLPSSLRVIEAFAFANCGSLKNIQIPNGVTQINSCALASCTSMYEVTLPDSLERMEDNIFENVPIRRLVIPAKVTNLPGDLLWYANSIKELEFLGKTPELLVDEYDLSHIFTGISLTRIIVPDGWKQQYSKVFNIYTIVERQVAYADGDLSWNNNLFEQWEWNTAKNFFYPSGKIETIEGKENSQKQSAIGYSVIEKPKGNAYGTVKVTGYFSVITENASSTKSPEKNITTITIPEYISYSGKKYRVTEIGDKAFFEFQKLHNLVLPQSIQKIGKYALFGTGLNDIKLPDSLTELGEGAFAASSLSIIQITPKLKVLGEGAYGNCIKLTKIIVDKKNASFKTDGKILYNKKGDTIFTSIPLKENLVIKSGVKTIKRGAFYNSYAVNTAKGRTDSTITKITVPATVKIIEEVALYGIKRVEMKGKQPPQIKSPIYAYIKVPVGSINAYRKLKVSGEISFLNIIFGYEDKSNVFIPDRVS